MLLRVRHVKGGGYILMTGEGMRMFAHLSTHPASCGGSGVGTYNSIKKRRNVKREVKITFATSDQKECATLRSSRSDYYNPKIFHYLYRNLPANLMA